jgi:hypothetical protein
MRSASPPQWPINPTTPAAATAETRGCMPIHAPTKETKFTHKHALGAKETFCLRRRQVLLKSKALLDRISKFLLNMTPNVKLAPSGCD